MKIILYKNSMFYKNIKYILKLEKMRFPQSPTK